MPPERVLKPDLNTDWAAASSDWLDGMVAHRRAERIHALFGKDGGALDLHCGTDQVGTLKILTDTSGKLVKEVQRDSFGILLFDSQPDLFMPIGFAGGLEDPDTGFVRFGYRDYDPAIGRFTAPDPLGDTGGDHDSYDYCIDDPVTLNDPEGLFPPLLWFLGGKIVALGIAAAGAYSSAWAADTVTSVRNGKKSSDAVDAMNRVAPHVGKAAWDSTLPGRMGIGAATKGVGFVLGTKAAIDFVNHGRSDSRKGEHYSSD